MPKKFDQKAAVALTTLVNKVLSSPAKRRAFAEKPGPTAKAANVNLAALPPAVRETLKGMSERELQFFADVHKTLAKEGLYVEIDGLAVCIFL
jgi:hypothetical protein